MKNGDGSDVKELMTHYSHKSVCIIQIYIIVPGFSPLGHTISNDIKSRFIPMKNSERITENNIEYITLPQDYSS